MPKERGGRYGGEIKKGRREIVMFRYIPMDSQ